MEFCKNGQVLKAVDFFDKHCVLDVWLGFEYRFVIWYSLFEKDEDINKIDSVPM